MPLLTIAIDAVAALLYYFQLNNPGSVQYLFGLVGQIIITIVLIVITFSYQGPRLSRFRGENFVRPITFRYSIIVISTVLNALLLFLYFLNYLGINPVVFSAF